MKKSVIKSAKTVEEAINLALLELNTTRDKVEIEIIEQPSSGFLGLIGVKPAIIKVVESDIKYTAKTKETVFESKPKIKEKTISSEVDIVQFVQQLCDYIVKGCVVKKVSEDNESVSLTIDGDNIGLIVGKHGETLNALQYLAAMVYSKQKGCYCRVSVDAGGYRQRREKKIVQFGTRMAEKARRTGRRISLEPMNSYERRIIHMALQEVEGINTFSEGDEPNRRVVITPSNNRSNNNRYNKKSSGYAKEERKYKVLEKHHDELENQTKQNKKNHKVNNKKQEESNPYEHYYSKYDNRYKK